MPLTIGLIGPLPPPNGGMAMQTLQLARLLREEGVEVVNVPTNAPYRPKSIEKVKLIRAVFRLLPYLCRVWGLAGRVNVIHLMANSGWSWQLFSAPVLWVGWLRKTPVIVNYRGGEAREYLQKSAPFVKPSLAKAASVVVPSGFLEKVFGDYGVATQVIPNIIDLETFFPGDAQSDNLGFTIVITRNLEPIYGLETAILCVSIARQVIPNLKLKIAGSGPQLNELQQLVETSGLQDCVTFLGRLERADIVSLYQSADVMLNPSLVDNMPNSVLEALACGLPVISTNVGGVPFMVVDGETAMLVEPDDPQAMADVIIRLYSDTALQGRLRRSGIEMVDRFTWRAVKEHWLQLYRSQSPSVSA